MQGFFIYFCRLSTNHLIMDKNHLAIMLLTVAMPLAAEIPAGYYSSLDGLRDQSLKDQLCDIIHSHTRLNYNSLWDYYPETDAYPERVNDDRNLCTSRTVMAEMGLSASPFCSRNSPNIFSTFSARS